MPTYAPSERETARRREVGERIRLARRHANLSQMQVGERAGLSHKTISRIELAQSDPTLGMLISLADAIGVPLDDLVREQNRPH
ncbi:helix-turn-helix domain-containing protein [Streptomyces liangshanensis]|uniref:helix-turn-helix domain-containing protein n=1 Tax=Streptomyces liangshanensis TaxID=2717324 RepID=UPI0036DD36B0